MGVSSTKRISYRSVYFLVLWLCRGNGAKTDFQIYRGERDIFTNPGNGTHSESRSTNSCSKYNAECADGDKCDYCRCSEGKNTLITNGGTIKECVRDEEIVPESVPEDRFWLKNSEYNECLKLNGNLNQVVRTNCSSPTLDMFWIWTENQQLINVKNLKCMERKGEEKVIIKQCSTTGNKQKMQCTGYEEGIKIGSTNKIFLHLTQSKRRVIFKKVEEKKVPQQWSNKKQTPCETSSAYNGCYRFSDGSFLKYLDYTTRKPKLRISAPMFKGNQCNISTKFTYFRDNYTGESESASVFTFNNQGKTIQFKTMEVFKAWNGSLIKLSVVCEKQRKEKHCILLKLASKPSFSQVINNTQTPSRIARTTETTTLTESTTLSSEKTTGSNQDSTTPYSGSSKVVAIKSTTVENTNTAEARTAPANSKSTEQNGKREKPSEPPRTSKTSTTGKPPESKRKQASASDGTNATAVAITVPLLVIALVLAIAISIYRRRRKRAHVPQKSNNGTGIVNYSAGTDEDPYQMYETLEDHENAISYHDLGSSSHTYTSPHSQIAANSPSNEQEYTYAQEKDFLRSSLGNKPEAKKQMNNNQVHETLDLSDHPDDSFYHYPENTITQPLASELEYAYAKDTDIPRVCLDKTAVPKKPEGSGVYQTLEQEQPPTTDLYQQPDINILNELEYSYAKDTDIPRITVDKTMSDKPASNAVHQTSQKDQPLSKDLYKQPDADIPTKLEYTYARDTEIPRIAVDTTAKRDNVPVTGTEQRDEHSVPQNDSALYHTLEEPKPPQPPVYSTLQEPDDIDQ